ncbi:unnamed protein product, partial [Vicia faba]
DFSCNFSCIVGLMVILSTQVDEHKRSESSLFLQDLATHHMNSQSSILHVVIIENFNQSFVIGNHRHFLKSLAAACLTARFMAIASATSRSSSPILHHPISSIVSPSLLVMTVPKPHRPWILRLASVLI